MKFAESNLVYSSSRGDLAQRYSSRCQLWKALLPLMGCLEALTLSALIGICSILLSLADASNNGRAVHLQGLRQRCPGGAQCCMPDLPQQDSSCGRCQVLATAGHVSAFYGFPVMLPAIQSILFSEEWGERFSLNFENLLSA